MGWSGYARVERNGEVWRLTQPVEPRGSVVIEMRPDEGEFSAAMGQELTFSLLRGLHEMPQWLTATYERRVGTLPIPQPVSEGGWRWSDTFAGVGFSVAVVFPPEFDDPEAVMRRMVLLLRFAEVGPHLH